MSFCWISDVERLGPLDSSKVDGDDVAADDDSKNGVDAEDENEAKVREEIKRRNIDENFNFFESFFVLKQSNVSRSHSGRHGRGGRLALRNLSRLQLLRLMSNIVRRWTDIHVSARELLDILKAVFSAKLNGKRFENASYSRFKQILGAESDAASNVGLNLYQSVQMYFEAALKTETDAERKYQGLWPRIDVLSCFQSLSQSLTFMEQHVC